MNPLRLKITYSKRKLLHVADTEPSTTTSPDSTPAQGAELQNLVFLPCVGSYGNFKEPDNCHRARTRERKCSAVFTIDGGIGTYVEFSFV